MKPYAESCDENREPILAVLRDVFANVRLVLEIGSGTGQHAAWFPDRLGHLVWQPTDRWENLPGIRSWVGESGLENVLDPLLLDVNQPDWGVDKADAVFSANTAHIMDWPSVCSMFEGVGRVLRIGGVFALYGPFNYHGAYSSESNARFDAWLKARDPASGLRDLDDLKRIGGPGGLVLERDIEMPVNNRTLIWRKTSGTPIPDNA